MKQVLGKKWF